MFLSQASKKSSALDHFLNRCIICHDMIQDAISCRIWLATRPLLACVRKEGRLLRHMHNQMPRNATYYRYGKERRFDAIKTEDHMTKNHNGRITRVEAAG